jgi:lysophospholipase L1-like esterase
MGIPAHLHMLLAWMWTRCSLPARYALAAARMRLSARRHHRERWASIASALAAAGPGHVFLAGDSHAELLGTPDFGRATVNGGIGAIYTADYARGLARLGQRPRAAASVLIVGSNDTHLHRGPASEGRRRAFAAAVDDLIERLQACSDVVLVAAIPPVCAPMADHRHLGATAAYAEMLEAACTARGGVFIDPFAQMRGPDPARAAPGVRMDALGAHLADYGALARALAPSIAAALADQSAPRSAGRPMPVASKPPSTAIT